MLLCENKELFNELIRAIYIAEDILPSFIEKDFYALTVLKELVKRDNNFVFNGGTSLSVCQHAINRFSEDIDVSYSEELITTSNRKRIKQAFIDSINAVSLTISNLDNIRSRRVFNRYLCPYESEYDSLNNRVIVEWAIITPSFPIEIKTAQTIIGKYLTKINRLDLVEKYGLEEFEVKTITKERTLVDKIFAICDYHISQKLDRQSRHIYDIHQLLSYVNLDGEFMDLFNKVKSYRKDLETCYSSKEGMVISSLLFELIEKDTYLKDYNEKTFPLLYDGVKYEECIKTIKKIADFLKANNL